MWLEAQRLFDFVDKWVSEEAEGNSAELISQLEKYKAKIVSVTKNKPKSRLPGDQLKVGASMNIDGIPIELDTALCMEAETISTVFDIHQNDAIKIVLSGEMQQENFCSLPRGLLAVVCYYDYHRFLAVTLRTLLELESETIEDRVKSFIDNNFINLALFKHLLQVQSTFSVQSEFLKLSQPEINGLGGARHQMLLRTVIEDLGEAIGDCLYSIASWTGDKAKDFAAELYPILKNFPIAEKLSNGHMAVWASLIRLTSPEVLTKGNVTSQVMADMIREIRNETTWSDQSLCGTVQLACAISLRVMAMNPTDHLNIVNVEVDVDKIVDRAVQNHTFKFLRYAIIGSDVFTSNISYIKIVDSLLKKLICNFPAKLLEIERDGEDELNYVDEMNAKGQTIAPNLHYANVIGCLSDLYFLIDSTKLSDIKRDEMVNMSAAYSPYGSIELARFMERSRIVCHPIHAVAYLEFERAICRTQVTAAFLFDVFARVPADQDTYIGWEQFMATLRIYEQRFRQPTSNVSNIGGSQPQVVQIPEIPQNELAGLISWITLARNIADLDSESAGQFIDNRSWSFIDCANGLIASPTPIRFKGALLSFLASLAKQENGVMRIWHSLNAYQICRSSESGTLFGMQQELEERECAAKRFDATLGMVQLLQSLFSHGTIPEFAAPYIQFLTKSVISQMGTRSYEDVHQLWDIAEKSLEAVYSLIRHSYTDTRSLIQRDQHIQLLVQLLNDTPVLKAICYILLEDSDGYVKPAGTVNARLSQKTALTAIKLLSLAISRHAQLKTAIKSTTSDIIVASIQSILLTPLRNSTECMLDVIFLYLDQVNELPIHAYHAATILRELCSVRPSQQKTITELLKARTRNGSTGLPISAVWKVLDFGKIEYSTEDIIKSDADTADPIKCRGETTRILLEIFCDAVDTDPSNSNICFLLFGFQKNRSGQLFSHAARRTGFHNIVDILENFCFEQPFSYSYSALIEPSFRLIKRLTSVECNFSTEILRFLRSNDFIVRLIENGSPLHCMEQFDLETMPTQFALSRMIVGSILHLCAVEVSTLLKSGHIDTPLRLYKKLFDVVQDAEDTQGECCNVLFSIFHNNRNLGVGELDFVVLEHFDSHKLQMISEHCKSTTSFGTAQYDIKSLHDLLKREIVSTQNENTILSIVEKEMMKVLEYFTDLNNQLLLRGAAESLVSGCTAILNVIAIFSPVPFFSLEAQLDLLCDSVYSVIEFTSTCTDNIALSLSMTLQRLIKTIASIAKDEYKDEVILREFMGKLLIPLLELIVLPIERPFQTKIALYESARLCLKSCFINTSQTAPNDWLQEVSQGNVSDAILLSIEHLSYDLNQRIMTDISGMVLELKIHPLLFLGDLLREDALGSKKIATFFAKSGMPRYLADLLSTLEIDWTAYSRGEPTPSIILKLFNAIMLTIVRLAHSDPGWNALVQLNVLEIFANIPILKKAPSDIFLKPETVNSKGTAANLYSQGIDLIIHFCWVLCCKPKWKRLSPRVLDLVNNLSELMSQLIRAKLNCDLLSHCADLIYYIWECDEECRPNIERNPTLNALRNMSKSITQSVASNNKEIINFAIPTSL